MHCRKRFNWHDKLRRKGGVAEKIASHRSSKSLSCPKCLADFPNEPAYKAHYREVHTKKELLKRL